MKKILSFFMLFAILMTLSLVSASADLELPASITDLLKPTIDVALSKLDSLPDFIEVSDDLSAYDPDNFGEIDYGDYRFIILERRVPEKEFTAFDSGYPDHYVEGLPDDFTGVDSGSPSVWLRADLMKRLPADLRATSMEDADILLIAEDQYYLSGTITITDYSKDDEGEVPEFETTEELMAYLREHQPKISAITYYPTFDAYALIDIYNPATKQCAVYDYLYSPRKSLASNPDAAAKLREIEGLAEIMASLNESDVSVDEFVSEIDSLQAELPQEKLDFWASCISGSEYAALSTSMNEALWEMAAELIDLDQDETHQANYRLIIEQQDYEALAMFAEYCNYSGFDTPISVIEETKAYMASPDYDWLESTLDDLITEIAG